jgi:hypothetical protein
VMAHPLSFLARTPAIEARRFRIRCCAMARQDLRPRARHMPVKAC